MKKFILLATLALALPAWSQSRGPRNPRQSYPMEQTIVRQAEELNRAARNLLRYVDSFGRHNDYWDTASDIQASINAVFETARFVQSVQVFHDLVVNDRITWTYYQLPAAYNKLKSDANAAIRAVEQFDRTLNWRESILVLADLRDVEKQMHDLGRAIERIDRRVRPSPNPGRPGPAPAPIPGPAPRPLPRYDGFVVAECSSINDQPNYCSKQMLRLPPNANIVFVERDYQLSNAACIEGKDWTWDTNGISVFDGCRARFKIYYLQGRR